MEQQNSGATEEEEEGKETEAVRNGWMIKDLHFAYKQPTFRLQQQLCHSLAVSIEIEMKNKQHIWSCENAYLLGFVCLFLLLLFPLLPRLFLALFTVTKNMWECWLG